MSCRDSVLGVFSQWVCARARVCVCVCVFSQQCFCWLCEIQTFLKLPFEVVDPQREKSSEKELEESDKAKGMRCVTGQDAQTHTHWHVITNTHKRAHTHTHTHTHKHTHKLGLSAGCQIPCWTSQGWNPKLTCVFSLWPQLLRSHAPWGVSLSHTHTHTHIHTNTTGTR